MKMFRDIHKVDPNVKLFLNDFAVVRKGYGNRATVRNNQALLGKRFGSLVHASQKQLHVRDSLIIIMKS